MVPCFKTGFFLGEKKIVMFLGTSPTCIHPVHLSAIVQNIVKPKARKMTAQARSFSYRCCRLAAVNLFFLSKTDFIQICNV